MRAHGYLAFLCGICITVLACHLVMQAQQSQIADDFQRDSDKITRDTSMRMQSYFDILLSIKGMLAIDEEAGRQQLSTFIRELDLKQRYPGYRAVQFVRKVPSGMLDGYVAGQRRAGAAGFTPHPPVVADDHYIIEFSEPVKGNEAALGLDLAALPPHRQTLEIGRDSGAIVVGPRTVLVQDPSGEPGFVARVPVFHQSMPLDTLEQRRAALTGYAALVFRMSDLMREVIPAAMLSHIAVTMHDAGYAGAVNGGAPQPPSPANLMYDSNAAGAIGAMPLGALHARSAIIVGQRQWIMQFAGYDGERYGHDRDIVAIIGVAGVAFSALLAAVLVASRRRRLLAEQLRLALDEQHAFQDSASVGIGLFAGGMILRCNRGLEEMMGYGPGQLSGLASTVLIPGGAPGRSDPFDCLHGDAPLSSELPLLRRDGGVIWCTVNGRVLDGHDHAKGCVWVIHDISDRKRTEAALLDTRHGLEHSLAELEQQKRQVELARRDLEAVLVTLKQAQTNLVTSEKMASLGSLVAGIAHELNTPIGNSLLTASALNDMVRDFERKMTAGGVRKSVLEAHLADSRHACAIISASLGRAADLITSFKQVAVDQASDQRRAFELGAVLRDTLATFAAQLRRAQCDVILNVPPGLFFESYPGSIGQVISNLLNNALLHAFEGRERGHITISVEEPDASHATLVFSDDGVGMPPNILHQIFDPFFTTKMGQGGSGLGMNIVYNIVTGILKGTIAVRSQPGSGTTVTLVLPKIVPEHGLHDADSADRLLAPIA